MLFKYREIAWAVGFSDPPPQSFAPWRLAPSVFSRLQKYDRMFQSNERVGSFYLQSKVQRAKERLEAAQRGDSAP